MTALSPDIFLQKNLSVCACRGSFLKLRECGKTTVDLLTARFGDLLHCLRTGALGLEYRVPADPCMLGSANIRIGILQLAAPGANCRIAKGRRI